MDLQESQALISGLTEQDILQILRAKRPVQITEEGLKPSAVMVPLIRRTDGWCALFTRRSQNVEHHKGEISFPGGTIEPGESALGAALREIEEEIGIQKDSLRILGELDEIMTMTGFRVRCFVASIDWPVAIKPSREEIDEIYILPLSKFLNPEIFHTNIWKRNGEDYPVYFFKLDECVVWGATAKILKNLLERLLGISLA